MGFIATDPALGPPLDPDMRVADAVAPPVAAALAPVAVAVPAAAVGDLSSQATSAPATMSGMELNTSNKSCQPSSVAA